MNAKKSWVEKIKSLQAKISGDNWMNYWGWRFTGVLVLFVTLGIIGVAIFWEDAPKSPECLLLIAIWMVLMGHFCLALQNYGARVIRTIEAEERKKNETT
jgi:hypothetical protein